MTTHPEVEGWEYDQARQLRADMSPTSTSSPLDGIGQI